MRFSRSILLALLLMLAASLASAETIPAGSHATVRLNTSLSSATAHTGEAWSGTLTHDIVEHGKVVVRAGAPVKGKVTYVNRSGRLHKPGALTLRLSSINGETVYSSRVSRQGKSHTKSNATKIGGGAGESRSPDWRNCWRRQGRSHRRSSGSRRGNRSCRRYRQAGSQNPSGECSHLYDYRIKITKQSAASIQHSANSLTAKVTKDANEEETVNFSFLCESFAYFAVDLLWLTATSAPQSLLQHARLASGRSAPRKFCLPG